MAKLTTTPITSGYASNTALNANFDLIETALENTLSRDGTTPNTMGSNLDMNGYMILNQSNPVVVSGFVWEGPWITLQAYSIGDIVEKDGIAYICVVAHTSSTFATDLAAVKWQLFTSGTLPPQVGNSGKYLKTDGTNPSWDTVVESTSSTGSAILPSGTTAQRDGTPVDGYTRFNSTITALEVWYLAAWNTIATTANAVLTTGNQTIAGIKTFSNNLINFTGTEATLQVNGIEALKFNSQGLITTPITVRQTVELGPVDTNGFASFGGSTGSTTVTASGTLYLNAANGMVNRRGSITNPSWTGASTNGTMYAYLDIAADGSCTTGLSTLAPTYRWGGADVVTSGQFTFNITPMEGKVGNGATAVQTYRVYAGEFTVAGNVVTAIVWYALNGMALVKQATLALGTAYNLTTNIGTILSSVADRYFVCLTTEAGIAVGSKVPAELSASATASGYGSTCSITDRNTIKLYTSGTSIGSVATGGSTAHLTAANWSFECYVRRAW